MKKLMLALVALVMVGISFTGCKVEKSEVTVSVYDTMGNPVNNRAVLYTDAVSSVLDTFIPSPGLWLQIYLTVCSTQLPTHRVQLPFPLICQFQS